MQVWPRGDCTPVGAWRERANDGQKVQWQQLVVCSIALDRTQAVIDRNYRTGTCGAERELEQKGENSKIENKENQKQN